MIDDKMEIQSKINYYSENGKFEPTMRSLTDNEMEQRNQIFHNILNKKLLKLFFLQLF